MIPAETQELDIIAAIRAGAEISVCIPDDTPSPRLFLYMKECGRQIDRVDRYSRALRYAMGKMMTMAARRPEFLADCGFKEFQQFEDAMIQTTGMSRSILWDWKPIYEKLPELTREQLAHIPRESLTLIIRNIPESKQEMALQVAAEITYRKFKVFAETEGFIGPGEADGASLIVTGNKATIAEIRAFLDHPEVQDYVGTSDYAELLIALIGESQSTEDWPKVCPRF
jgi:hypothetical protein